jgi:A/G-specific adenine glycosylase
MGNPRRIQYITRAIERWFTANQRPLPWRDGYDPYDVWVSEVMLQQTRMEVVLGYFERFMTRFPTIKRLASSSVDDVLAAWSGLGYYRRARMLHQGAIAVAQRGSMPRSVDELMTIPGIGRYTAGAIASIAFGQRAPIVDGNVKRVLARLEGDESDPWSHAAALVDACDDPRMLNQGLMELGALVCTPRNPSCDVCAVRKHCVAYETGRVDELPRPKAKPATRELRIPLYLVTDHRGHVLMRRERGQLMTSMLHLPHGDSSLFGAAPLDVARTRLLGKFRHTVTNRRIEFEVFDAELASSLHDGGDYEWIDVTKLRTVAHPSYVAKALRVSGRFSRT